MLGVVKYTDQQVPDLFAWLADHNGEVEALCQSSPRLTRLLDEYISLLLVMEKPGVQGTSCSHALRALLSEKAGVIRSVILTDLARKGRKIQ